MSDRQLEAVGQGIRASGDDFAFADKLSEEADVALVVSGLKYPGSKLYDDREKILTRFNGRTLVSESPFFRQGAQPHDGPDPYFRLSVGGFMRDDGKFHPEWAAHARGRPWQADGSRWQRISEEQGLEVLPWRHKADGPILICMQKPSDASLRGLDVKKWTQSVILKLFAATKNPIVVRPHPLDKKRADLDIRQLNHVGWSKNPELADDLKNAGAVVTYTSLSAIESVMAGVPTFCLSEANHAWPMSVGDDLSLWERIQFAEWTCVNRHPWLDRLSWGQWKLSELREGTPWRRLRPLLT